MPGFLSSLIAVQKFAFMLYIGVYFYNGVIFNLFNDYLTPEKSSQSWFRFFSHNGATPECKDFLNIFNNHQCIHHLFIVDNAEVLKVISGMTPFAKWRYLLIVMTCKFLTPYLLQFSMLVMLFMAVYFIYSHVLEILDACGISPLYETTRLSMLRQTICSKISSFTGISQLAIIPGLLIASYVTCLLTSRGSEADAVCENTACLYCISSLSKTIFKAVEKYENAILTSTQFHFMVTPAKLITMGILSVSVWFFTIVSACCAVYFIIEVFYNFRFTGTDTVVLTWNNYIPSFQATFYRIVQIVKTNQAMQSGDQIIRSRDQAVQSNG